LLIAQANHDNRCLLLASEDWVDYVATFFLPYLIISLIFYASAVILSTFATSLTGAIESLTMFGSLLDKLLGSTLLKLDLKSFSLSLCFSWLSSADSSVIQPSFAMSSSSP
jgi:hypothetical protein